MIKIKKLFITSLTLLSTTIYANDCQEIRLDKGENAPFKDLPIHDQMYGKKTDSQMCYAFAGSQFIDAVIQNDMKVKGHITSPITTALQTKLSPTRDNGSSVNLLSNISRGAGRSGLGVGQINILFKQMKQGYSCDQNFLTSIGIKDPNTFWEPFVYEFYANKSIEEKVSTLKNELKLRGVADEFFNIVEDETLAQAVSKKGFYLREQLVFEKLCEGHKINLNLPELEYHDYSPSDIGFHETDEEFKQRFQVDEINQNAIQNISDSLESGNNLPVIVDICAEVLTEKNKSFKRSLPAMNGSCSNHSVLVIGQRKAQDNSCQYLVRNSWGDYRKYDQAWEVDEKGQIWVDAKTLSSSILKVIHAR
ncbi:MULTISPECIES: hypothetical protein [unclassified Halobacteriovorax]|uniref:hypothetical protein n=1 Tax=unclassified Halobacteriovorax TaxID=2639665 RepID=UPI00399C1B5E